MPNQQVTYDADVTYDAAMQRAETIATTLSRGAGSLGDALSLYEEGITLLARAAAQLHAFEQRAQELIERADGSLGLSDLAQSTRQAE